jgi:phosphoribosylamine--glycine ligase/phosphoribosylformylglycinamidine cyclo-ligase
MSDDGLAVLVIGSGGREHAIAAGLIRSPRLGRLHIASGNAGTRDYNVDLDINNNLQVVDYCVRHGVDLVVVGPEKPLVAGIADDLNLAGIPCFGPSAGAAQLEGSKSFARQFAARHGIPSPVSQSFTEVGPARAWLEEIDFPVVVKADGLAGGKGVIVPADRVETERAIFSLLADRTMGTAGETIVLEQRLIGEEVSLFGIADGHMLVPLVTAQDHKRVGEGNTGLNTGGMGAFAPVPSIHAELEADLVARFLTPAVEGMAAEGHPYVGILYAGIMLTAQGPRLIEYNCRFGDPEAQVIVPLIESDLLEVLWSAAVGELADHPIKISDETAAAVVVAAEGYPTNPRVGVPVPIVEPPPGVEIFHAGTCYVGNDVASSGGRVLSVVGTGPDLAEALERAYSVVDKVTGKGLFARSDIGWRHAPRARAKSAYAEAGVSLAAGAAATARMATAVRSTHDERVVAGLGAFGGVFDMTSLAKLSDPLLVASTDGVGTKTVLARQLDRWEGCGADIVNHSIDDLLAQGARPLFFLDTVASAELDPEIVGRIIEGMAGACRDAGCVLLGGETAEMPGVLASGAIDISGTMVGAVERAKLLPTDAIAPGHRLVGLASSGLHTNGYSLARKVFAGVDLNEPLPGGPGTSAGDALLAVHRSYLTPLTAALDAGLVDGLAHITGGGFVDNLPRIMPRGCGAIVDTSAWDRPVLFNYLIARGGLTEHEAHKVFNCGIGMVAVVAPDLVAEFQASVPEPTWVLGEVIIGGGVTLK